LVKKTVVPVTKTDMDWSARVRRRAVVAVLTVGLACVSARPATAGDCAPAVVVRGAEPLRTTIAAELARNGISAPSPGCVGQEVTVTRETTKLTLTMIDAYGRVTRRTVTDVGAACALIESRIGAELLASLLPQGDAPGVGEAVAELAESDVSPAAPVAVLGSAPVPVASAPGRGVSLFVATELAAGSDRSGWAGLSVSGCVMLGPTCLGAIVRFWHDLDASDESANVISKRDTGEVDIALDLPFTRRRIDFRPGVELGVGWVHMGGFGTHPDTVDDNEFDHGDVSAGLHVGATFPLSSHWAAEGDLGASISLFAHQAPFVVDGVMLPGEPRAFCLASLGLRYGIP
jgi:hypothetical protein